MAAPAGQPLEALVRDERRGPVKELVHRVVIELVREQLNGSGHLIPSPQAPHLFWEPTNLVAACGRCNYGGGARIAAENKRTTIAKLRTLVWEQRAEIDRLTERLGRYEDATRTRTAIG